MAESEGVDRVFFELASESRLCILRELSAKNYKMQELARKLDLTDTEAFRQLQRLSEALLIQRQPDGAYAITQYGKLLMQFSLSFEFAAKHKSCLLTRDIWRIPEPFVNRLGELAHADLNTNTLEMLNSVELLIKNVESHLWIMSNQPMNLMGSGITERYQKNPFTIRIICDEASAPLFENTQEIKGVLEKRVIPALPVTMVLSEKYAGVNLLSLDGRADSAIFYGKDRSLMKWSNDLFLYYWDQAKRWFPK